MTFILLDREGLETGAVQVIRKGGSTYGFRFMINADETPRVVPMRLMDKVLVSQDVEELVARDLRARSGNGAVPRMLTLHSNDLYEKVLRVVPGWPEP